MAPSEEVSGTIGRGVDLRYADGQHERVNVAPLQHFALRPSEREILSGVRDSTQSV